MQWIGALLFIGMTTLIGFNISTKLNERPKHIRQMKNALQILEAEILYSQLPLPDVFATIAMQIPQPASAFFNKLDVSLRKHNVELYSIWAEHVDVLMNTSALDANEGEILKQFGRTLGQHDFDQQQKHIHLTIKHLDRELDDAREQQYKYSKMAKSLGLLSGIFIVLLLI
ncbi:stage III sporulation protein SpoIIIAB [Lentibacillus sp. CBA3610]|uniref:stage III sporulation protein SpoIIIAB n=1 Tax=Lentibacillus sp. CBA3610 TaxID=2518176 RepID=UPI001595CB55|nr:stage III sporulation protein SpoIIIAB [Lentibacillus sp. CBA3610]QKY69305.1 stage III sporulation protein SpoAB [Lentibacillus sp. CBA3610]